MIQKKVKEEGMYNKKTKKILHNQHSRRSREICKSSKGTLDARKLPLDTGCNIQRRCKQDIEQKFGKEFKHFKEISNINTGRTTLQKEI